MVSVSNMSSLQPACWQLRLQQYIRRYNCEHLCCSAPAFGAVLHGVWRQDKAGTSSTPYVSDLSALFCNLQLGIFKGGFYCCRSGPGARDVLFMIAPGQALRTRAVAARAIRKVSEFQANNSPSFTLADGWTTPGQALRTRAVAARGVSPSSSGLPASVKMRRCPAMDSMRTSVGRSRRLLANRRSASSGEPAFSRKQLSPLMIRYL